jgi:hypothetical protein
MKKNRRKKLQGFGIHHNPSIQRRITRSGRKKRIRGKIDEAYLRLGACARRPTSSWIRSCSGPPPFALLSPGPPPSALLSPPLSNFRRLLLFRVTFFSSGNEWGKYVRLFLYTRALFVFSPSNMVKFV